MPFSIQAFEHSPLIWVYNFSDQLNVMKMMLSPSWKGGLDLYPVPYRPLDLGKNWESVIFQAPDAGRSQGVSQSMVPERTRDQRRVGGTHIGLAAGSQGGRKLRTALGLSVKSLTAQRWCSGGQAQCLLLDSKGSSRKPRRNCWDPSLRLFLIA